MKKSDKIISTILILAILIGGGYFAAKHFGLIGASASIEDVEEIETVEIWNVDTASSADIEYQYLEQVSAMEDSNANYFIGAENGEGGFIATISQTNKETFDSEMTAVSSNTVINCVDEMMKNTFNQDFKSQSDTHKETLLEELGHMPDAEFLVDNNVKLKCKSIKIDKILAYNSSTPYNPVRFIVIGTAEVTTTESDGDISSTCFGNKDETVTINFNTWGRIIEYGGCTGAYLDYSANRYTFFEQVE